MAYVANPAPANEDNPPPPLGLNFEDYKKTIKIEFNKPYPNEFIRRISPYKAPGSILPLLQKCVLITPSDSEEEGEFREVDDTSKTDLELVEEVWALIQKKKEKEEIPPTTEGKKTSEDEQVPSTSRDNQDCLPSFPVVYSPSPSPEAQVTEWLPVEAPAAQKVASRSKLKFKIKKSSKSSKSSKDSGLRHASSPPERDHRRPLSPVLHPDIYGRSSYGGRELSSKSPERSHRKHVSPPPRSYRHSTSSKSRSEAGSSSRSSHRLERHRSFESRSKSPEEYYRRKGEERRYDSRSKSPDSYYRRKGEERHKRHRSYGSRSKSPEDLYYRGKEVEHYKRKKRSTSPRIDRSRTPSWSPDLEARAKRKQSKKDPREPGISQACSSKLPYSPPDSDDDYGAMLREEMRNRNLIQCSATSAGTEKEAEDSTRLIRLPSTNVATSVRIESEEEESAPLRGGQASAANVDSGKVDEKEKASDSKLEDSRKKRQENSARLSRQPATNVATSITIESEDEDLAPLRKDQASAVKEGSGKVRESEKTSDGKSAADKGVEDVKIKKEYEETKADVKSGILYNNFFCDLCQLALNSEVTWESHINGKKHAKAVKLQTVHEIAKGSLAIPTTPAVVSEDIPRFANAPAGKQRILIRATPRLQRTIDETTDRPVPGLDHLQEIISPMDVDYYCELCDAPCKSSSVMPHLVGFKHQLRALRELFPTFYERNKMRSDKSFKKDVVERLCDYEIRRGRGLIKVFKEIDDPRTRPAYDMPGPSFRSSDYSSLKKEDGDVAAECPQDPWLDMSKGDFFCKLCDSHMNNVNMWEAHVRGKRHLTNAKKIPGENISKMKSEKLYGERSILEDMIDDNIPHKLVVGLDFIRETRGPHGELYNCFLCGSCSTNFDILDHVVLQKHRVRYLEKMHYAGKKTSIKDIDLLELKDNYFRDSLVNDECYRLVEIYGRGKVEVYKSKN